jgi:hypothetical protein
MERPVAGRTWVWAGAAVVLVVVGTGTQSVHAGRRIGAVGAVCPADAPNKQIDENGVKDVCVARAPESCAGNRRLVQDAPVCTAGFHLNSKPKEDYCEY